MSEQIEISVPDFCLILLIGPSGAGKSSFAARHFASTEVISSDYCRALVADDEADQSATKDAFELVAYIAEKRLAARRLTVIDATNVKREDRAQFVSLAKKYHALVVGFVFFIDQDVCHARNANRPNRQFGRHVVRNQLRSLKRGFSGLAKREGVRRLHVFETVDEVDNVGRITRAPLWPDRRHEKGPFDIIGDVHGCAGELETLLTQLGYAMQVEGPPGLRRYQVTPPPGRRAIFVGDLVDRGPRSPDVLRLVKGMVDAGSAFCVAGNHENKLVRKLNGRNVQVTHGLAETMQQIACQADGFAEEMRAFLDGLISHYVFADGELVVAHAGLREDMHNRASGAVRAFALYGDTTGETDAFGLPVRADWAAHYRGRAKVVYGHVPTPQAEWVNGTICIDTGCVFGGKLTALRWPELDLVDVPAEKVWYQPVKPLQAAQPETDPTALHLSDVQGKRVIETAIRQRVTIAEANAASALETMSRFAIDPRWLIYLPPTMSPVETSRQTGWLERPEEAFDYYRRRGASNVICQEKHMGSRAVAVICRDQDAARKRFRADARRGVIYSRTGRPFFDADMEAAAIEQLSEAISAADWWQQLDADWFCLDMEIMPWSTKAQSLIQNQYAPLGNAADLALNTACEALEAAVQRGVDVADDLAKAQTRQQSAHAFSAAYQHYVWPVASIADLKIAPFHLLAGGNRTFVDHPHIWHMQHLAKLAEGGSEVIQGTVWRQVDLSDAAACAEAVAWWESQTASGSEGMVVKPPEFIAQGHKGLMQPAVKVRGKDYLRIIYGPDYDAADHLQRLRERSLGRKRALALQEFSLGIEALKRFTNRQPLARVHECVFGILELESEPIDPRL